VPGSPRDIAPRLQHERTGHLLRLVTQVEVTLLRTRLADGEFESHVLRVSSAGKRRLQRPAWLMGT
jgi:hypothetical protein